MKSPITTHVLDTSLGRPAAGIKVKLEQENGAKWSEIGSGSTDPDGRISNILPTAHSLQAGTYRLTFELRAYFSGQGKSAFYPSASITFAVDDPKQHYHIPLLLSGFGFSTYRGS